MNKIIPNIFNKYNFLAQYVPAIITVVPVLMLLSLIDVSEFESLFKYSNAVLVVGGIGIAGIMIIFLCHILRIAGKYLIEKKIFNEELNFPTTNFLLWQNKEFSNEKKIQLHNKIKIMFNIHLLALKDEKKDETEARLRIKDAVDQIRYNVKGGTRTLQYNIQYGMIRNLAGGIPIIIIFSTLTLIFLSSTLAVIIAIIYLALSVIFLIVFMPLLKALGNDYARYLLTEFLGKNND